MNYNFSAYHGLCFVLVKGMTIVMVCKHMLYAHWTSFVFVDVAWAQVRTITSWTRL